MTDSYTRPLRASRTAHLWLTVALLVVAALVLGACNSNLPAPQSQAKGDKVRVVATFSILSDMVEHIGGDRVEVHNLVPIGTDPHDFEPLPDDLKAMSEAEVFFYNGLNLEGGDSGWFARLTNSVGTSPDIVFEASQGITPMYLSDEKGRSQENPHAFLNPVNGMIMAENIRDALIEADPEGAQVYQQNAETYLAQLADMDSQYRDKFSAIPEQRRILVTSERAFQYMASEYGLQEGYIWAIDTDENGSPSQITGLVEFVLANDVPVVFVESNVDRRPMETVSRETGVPIGGVVMSDEIGHPGADGDSYLEYLHHNLTVISEGIQAAG